MIGKPEPESESARFRHSGQSTSDDPESSICKRYRRLTQRYRALRNSKFEEGTVPVKATDFTTEKREKTKFRQDLHD